MELLDKENVNIFFVSTVGQARNVETFIAQYNTQNNIVILLFTNKNLAALKNLTNKVKQLDNILEYRKLRLPNTPTRYNIKNMEFMYGNYVKLIEGYEERYKVTNIYMCSFASHYSYIHSIAKSKNIKVNLLEEGLGTYVALNRENLNEKEIVTINKVKDSCRKIKKNIKNLFKNLKNIFINSIILLIRIMSLIFKIDFEQIIKQTFISEKLKYKIALDFDKAYVCFPEVLANSHLKCNDINYLDLSICCELGEFLNEEFEQDSIIFLNQKYQLDNQTHFKIILEILDEMGISNIYIKFHPKENATKNKEQISEIIDEYNVNVKYFDGIDHLPIEQVLNNKNVKQMIGINSSTMVYGKIINEDIEIISIAKRYMQIGIEKHGIDPSRFANLKKDYEEIEKLFKLNYYIG